LLNSVRVKQTVNNCKYMQIVGCCEIQDFSFMLPDILCDCHFYLLNIALL